MTAFLSLREIVDEALALAGGEQATGYEFASTIRSLKMIFADWHTRGICTWRVAQGTLSTLAGTSANVDSAKVYTLPANVQRVLEVQRETTSDGAEVILTEMSRQEYASRTTKVTSFGAPTQYWQDRQVAAIDLYLWPVPDAVTTINYFYIDQIDAPGGGATGVDIPFYYERALVFGLAKDMAMKRPMSTPADIQRIQFLSGEYEACLQRAYDENRERSSMRVRFRRSY